MLARAVAGESNCAFIEKFASSFVTVWQGSGPQNVRDLFARARRYAPSVAFIDEIDVLRQRGPDRLSPLGIPKIIANMSAGMVSIEHNLLGPVSCTVTACSASANAIGDAAEIVRRGAADVMVAGGTEFGTTPTAMAGFIAAKAMSTRNDDPEGASEVTQDSWLGIVRGIGRSRKRTVFTAAGVAMALILVLAIIFFKKDLGCKRLFLSLTT